LHHSSLELVLGLIGPERAWILAVPLCSMLPLRCRRLSSGPFKAQNEHELKLSLFVLQHHDPRKFRGAQALYFNHLYDPISMVRDNEVKAAMAEAGVACNTFNSDVLYEPWEVLSPSNQPLSSFKHFWDRWVPPPPSACVQNMPRSACSSHLSSASC